MPARELNLTWANIKQSLGCLCKELRIRFMKVTVLKRQVRQLNSFCQKEKRSVAALPTKPSCLGPFDLS